MKVAFLDRDGTLIFEPNGGLVTPADFRILDGVIPTLRDLQEQGYALVLVTNQDFSKGPYNKECFEKTQEMLLGALEKEGIRFTKIFCCPHAIADNCECRKPKPGMVTKFLEENDIDREHSFTVGDREEADGGLADAIGVDFCRLVPNNPFPSAKEIQKRIHHSLRASRQHYE